MLNVHERHIDASADDVGALLDRLAAADDPLWPSPAWPPTRFDRPLAVGAAGGHASIGYTVTAYEPGRRVRCQFDPAILDGYHELSVEGHGDGCIIRHVISGRTQGAMILSWPLLVRWMHDALIEDLFDNAEMATTGSLTMPRRWPRYVRMLHRLAWPRARKSAMPPQSTLVGSILDVADLADAWSVPLMKGMPTDPSVWAEALFREQSSMTAALMHLRNKLVTLIGVERADDSAFDLIARTETEHMLGTDASHLDFRAVVLIGSDTITLVSIAKTHNLRGRVYLAIVKILHPAIVRGMLRRTSRRLALAARKSP